MIRLKSLIKEVEEPSKKELYEEYKKIADLFDRLSSLNYFNELKKLEKMSESFKDKIDAQSEEYKDSDEFNKFIDPLNDVVKKINEFAYWSQDIRDFDKITDNLNNALELQRNLPSETSYRIP